MNSKIVRVVSVLLSVFIIIYVIVQAVGFFYSPYEVQTVFKTTVNNSVLLNGLVLRDEEVISQEKSGVIRYQVQNGAKVAQQSVIAKKYGSEADMLAQEKAESIGEEIAVLTEAQDKGATAAATLDSITTQINESYLELMSLLAEKNLDRLQEYKLGLQGLLSKKQIIIGRQENYNERIEALRQEQTSLLNSIKTAPLEVKSPNSGYFAQTVDGLESQFACEDAAQITYDQVEALAKEPVSGQSSYIGKIIKSFEWKLVLFVSDNEVPYLETGSKVNVVFPSYGSTAYPVAVNSVELDRETGKHRLVLDCDIMDNNITKMRAEKVELILDEVTGIQIPKEAIRYEDNEMGVYEKTGRKLYFRKIDSLYENDDFVISKDHDTDDSDHVYVHHYDDVVIKGKDLYDKKPIS